MGWFTRLCRNTGLLIHHATSPSKGEKHVVSRETQEQKVSDTVTLRRTTIEEIELKPPGGSGGAGDPGGADKNV
jgi:hypothetical protein